MCSFCQGHPDFAFLSYKVTGEQTLCPWRGAKAGYLLQRELWVGRRGEGSSAARPHPGQANTPCSAVSSSVGMRPLPTHQGH